MNTNTTNSIAAYANKESVSSTFHSENTIPKGYRLTDVGVIPEDWEVKALGEVASTSSGTTPSRGLAQRYFSGGSINWVKTLDLNNSEIHSTDELVTHIALDETSLKIYPIGTVLIAMYGGFNQIGRTGISNHA
jgi:type I restriction enzyme S subunit